MDLAARLATVPGVDGVEELAGGHQSRVFRIGRRVGPPAVAKALDAALTDRRELAARLDVITAVADLDPRVCRPLDLAGRRITELATADQQHYVVCYELAPGTAPDPARPDDARRMGAALAHLHASMARVPAAPLPTVRALGTETGDDTPAAGPIQLLHGDFNADNLRAADGVIRIFDLDDCGYGPPAFDVANALYMVLFDASVQGAPETYETFRRSFVDGYASTPGPSLPDGALDRFIDRRVRALASWLDDLDTAPIGIRSASPAWHATLRSFVASYHPAAH